MIPILGLLAKVMIHKMGKAKGGLLTAYGTGLKLLTGAFKALHRPDLKYWSSSFTTPSNGQFSTIPGTTSPHPPCAVTSAYNAFHFFS